MKNDYLKEVYKDFFGEAQLQVADEEIEEESLIDIDTLLITDESKDLLKKITFYMEKYHAKEEERYLNFHIIIDSDNKELLERIESFLKSITKKNDYLENNNTKTISFYDVEKIEEFQELMSKNSLIVLKDIKGLDLKDETMKKRLFHVLEEEYSKKKLFILEGTKEEIDHFFEYDSLLREKAFPFVLEGRNPDVQELYQEVLGIVQKDKKVEDEFSVKILDYISETYEKREVDYPTYRDQLCREIIFHEEVPKLETEKTMDEIFGKLNELVGLEKVKKTLHELVDYMNLRKKSQDLQLSNVNLHMVFLGNPGTGKTTVARIVSEILYHLKYIKQNKLIEVSSKDLVAEYVGQTAPKTMSVVERAMGGVLFIDEAYALASVGNQNTYNDEAIATLIKAMEDHRDELVVIFAGYTKEMQAFLDSNSGIVSRVGYTLEFDDYTEDELVKIFEGMMKKAGFHVEEDAYEELRKIIRENMHTKNFGNARFVRNVYEKTIIKHASNTKDKKQKKILTTITKDDISCENM